MGQGRVEWAMEKGDADLTYTASLLAFNSRLVEQALTPFSSSVLICLKVNAKRRLTDWISILVRVRPAVSHG